MNAIQVFLRSVRDQAHLLGGIYYLWAILSGLSGAAYSGYKILSTPEIAGTSELLFFVFVALLVVVLMLVPLLVTVVIQRTNKSAGLSNPGLSIQSRSIEYRVSRTGLTKAQTLVLLAHSEVTCFRFTVHLTGNGSASVRLHSSELTLLGPVARGGADAYELRFATPMKRHETRTIRFDIEVDDPQGTMRPYLADQFHNARSYGEYKARYVFDPPPSRVFSEQLTLGGESLGSIQHLLPRHENGGAVYEVSVPRVTEQCSYTVSWIW